jgi:hypothetical protein
MVANFTQQTRKQDYECVERQQEIEDGFGAKKNRSIDRIFDLYFVVKAGLDRHNSHHVNLNF